MKILASIFAPLFLSLALALLTLGNPARPITDLAARSTRTFPANCRWTSAPCLIIGPSVDEGFAALAAKTWDRFLTAFSPLAPCIGDVHLRASYRLPARAGYDPASATVTVRVPGSAAKLRAALIHEWAHHIEFQCPQQRLMRPAFLAAEGFAPDTPWRPHDAQVLADTWANIPSEHFAEAAIELVLGHNPTPTQIHVTQEGLKALAAWLSGGEAGEE